MIFLIQYNRPSGTIVQLREFGSERRREVARDRLALELELRSRNVHDEVVTLEAESRVALETTHRRYFASAESLAHSAFTS